MWQNVGTYKQEATLRRMGASTDRDKRARTRPWAPAENDRRCQTQKTTHDPELKRLTSLI